MVRQSGSAFFLGSLLALGACKKSEDPAPVAPAPAPAKAEPAPGYTLSFLQDAQPSGCTWTRQDPGGARKVLFTVDAPCGRLGLAWSPNGRQGAVMDKGGGGVKPRAWTVDLESGQGSPLALPEGGLTDTLGFDSEGRPVALVSQVESLVRKAEGGAEHFLFEGQRLPIADSTATGAGLAHAFRREDDAWKRIETVATVFETDDAAGTGALAAAGTLVSSTSGVDADVPAAAELTEGSEEAARLDAVAQDKGHARYGVWVALETHGGPLYAWRASGELSGLMPPLRWEVQDRLVEPESLALPAASPVEVRVRGPLVLVSGAGAARIYDAKSKKRLAALDGVHGARFWPQARTITAAVPADAATGD
jgi:hypothetical protein